MKKSIYYLAAFLAGLGAFATAQSAVAQDAEEIGVIEIDEDQAPTGSESEEVGEVDFDDEITVTGTRMRRIDPSARMDVITAEEIKRRGLGTAEDVIRSIPQNMSSINSVTADSGKGNFDANETRTTRGYSSANLRGLGSSNTLVLINGKRIVSAQSFEDFTSNLRDIPAAAIERVEISFDGGSAIYGSDAVGGVINIILKKGYTGGLLTGRYEKSNTGADLWRVNGYLGKNWGTGSASVTASYTKGKPILNRKTGWVTRDYRDRFGPDADFRDGFNHRAGRVQTFDSELILPFGHNGVGATPGDFIPFDRDRDLIDFIDENASSRTRDLSVAFNIEQELFEGFKLSGGMLYSNSRSSSSSVGSSLQVTLPASNAYNPFGEEVTVDYSALAEVQAGLIPPNTNTGLSKQLQLNGRIDYEVAKDMTWVTQFTRSASNITNISRTLFSLPLFDESGTPGFIANVDPATMQRLRDILASSDPDATPNFFGDGSAQTAALLEFVLPQTNSFGTSTLMEAQTHLTGDLFDLPAGSVGFVVGGEWRREKLAAPLAEFSGVDEPFRDLWAGFAELAVPIFRDENAVPFIRELTLTAQARYDVYSMEGQVNTEPDPDDPFGPGTPIFGEARFDAVSPRFGIAWSPIDTLSIRASYSIGFKAPSILDLFTTLASFIPPDPTFPSNFDPLIGEYVVANTFFLPNPDLKPERSYNYNAGFDYAPAWAEGLFIRADFSRTDFKNLIASSSDLAILLPPEIYGNIPEFFVRDEEGNLIAENIRPINISRRVRDAVDADISYYFSTPWGEFTPGVNLSYVIRQYDEAAAGAAPVSFVGTVKGVDRYKLQGRVNWTKDNWGADLYVSHIPGYVNNSHTDPVFFPDGSLRVRDLPPEALRVGSYTTVDLTMNYRFENGLTMRAGARNLLNADFPFCLCDQGLPYDPTRLDLRGRVAFMEVSYDFSSLLGE